MQANILIVEDEADIADLLQLHLQDLNARVTVCGDGAQGLAMARSGDRGVPWDLMVLDLRLPGLDGLEICRRLRSDGCRVPILMLTAKTSELDRVLGLEVGADDYVLKPFSVIEVMARLRALLRRVSLEREHEQTPLQATFGRLWIDESKRSVSVVSPDEQVTPIQRKVDLTPREFDLLVYFAKAPGTVFRRTQLLDQVWGYGHEGYEHTVNSHINRLRSKLQQADPEHEYVMTVWGVGYKFNEDLVPQHAA